MQKNMKGSTQKLDQELKALVRLRDDQIDTSDIPEVTDWSKAVVRKFSRSSPQPLCIADEDSDRE